MANEAVPPLTPTEQQTDALIRRFKSHVSQWWPKLTETVEPPNFDFCVEDSPYQLWRGDFLVQKKIRQDHDRQDKAGNQAHGSVEETLWFLWNHEEVTSYRTEGEAYLDLIQGQKARRLDSKLKYYTSPLTISAILALLLLFLIFALELLNRAIPEQLWSIFTAVVAFYFGRESNRHIVGLGE